MDSFPTIYSILYYDSEPTITDYSSSDDEKEMIRKVKRNVVPVFEKRVTRSKTREMLQYKRVTRSQTGTK